MTSQKSELSVPVIKGQLPLVLYAGMFLQLSELFYFSGTVE